MVYDEDDITKTDLLEEIEDLKEKVLHLTHLLKFHGLLYVPIKYRKAFPLKGEYPFFEVEGFKENPKPFPLMWEALEKLPDKDKLDASKARTKFYGEKCLADGAFDKRPKPESSKEQI